MLRDVRGAVYLEFLMAFLPLLVFFASLVQLAFVELAQAVVNHAAVTAARAAIVVLPDDPASYGGEPIGSAAGGRADDIELAARLPLLAIDAAPHVDVRFPSSPGALDSRVEFAADDDVRVRVGYTYVCRVPIGNRFVCGLSGKKTLSAEAAMPNQGAEFAY